MPALLFTLALAVMIITLCGIIYLMRANKQMTENELYRMLGGTAALFYFSCYDLLSPDMLSFIAVFIGVCFGAVLSFSAIIQLLARAKNNKKIKVCGWITLAVILLFMTYFECIGIIIVPVVVYLVYYFLASIVENKLQAAYPKILKILSHISLGLFLASIASLIYFYLRMVFA